MDGPSVEHGHDLTDKLFGEEIGVWQNLCTDQLHHLEDKTHKNDTKINKTRTLLNFSDAKHLYLSIYHLKKYLHLMAIILYIYM